MKKIQFKIFLIFAISLALSLSSFLVGYQGNVNIWLLTGASLIVIGHINSFYKVWCWGDFDEASSRLIVYSCFFTSFGSLFLVVFSLYGCFKMSFMDYLISLASLLTFFLYFKNTILILTAIQFTFAFVYTNNNLLFLLSLFIGFALLLAILNSLDEVIDSHPAQLKENRGSGWIFFGILINSSLPVFGVIFSLFFMPYFIIESSKLSSFISQDDKSAKVKDEESKEISSFLQKNTADPFRQKDTSNIKANESKSNKSLSQNDESPLKNSLKLSFENSLKFENSHSGSLEEPIMWARIEDGNRNPVYLDPHLLFWKTGVMSVYNANKWNALSRLRQRINSKDSKINLSVPSLAQTYGQSIRQRVVLPPLGTPSLFAIYPVEWIDIRQGIYIDEEGILYRDAAPGPFRYELCSKILPLDQGLWERYRPFHQDSIYYDVPPHIRQNLNFINISKSIYNTSFSLRIKNVLSYLSSYKYTKDPNLPDEEDPTIAFLEMKRGYCQHFASAAALLLRFTGIPTRVAVGFMGGEWAFDEKIYVIYPSHAHAWIEIHFPKLGWVPFDPTPPNIIEKPSLEASVSRDRESTDREASSNLTNRNDNKKSYANIEERKENSIRKTGNEDKFSSKDNPSDTKKTAVLQDDGTRNVNLNTNNKSIFNQKLSADKKTFYDSLQNQKNTKKEFLTLNDLNKINESKFEKIWREVEEYQLKGNKDTDLNETQERDTGEVSRSEDTENVGDTSKSRKEKADKIRPNSYNENRSDEREKNKQNLSKPKSSWNFERSFIKKTLKILLISLGTIFLFILVFPLIQRLYRLIKKRQGKIIEETNKHRKKEETQDVAILFPKNIPFQNKVIQLYIQLIRKLESIGMFRKKTQTPFEFAEYLDDVFDPSLKENKRSAEIFVRARYSHFPVKEKDVIEAKEIFSSLWKEAKHRRGRPKT